jgi:integrative and conjugative element protein (TIGR02256 family)
MNLSLTTGQRLALDQLRHLAASSGGSIDIRAEPTVVGDLLKAEISLDCSGTPTAAGGLALRRRERFAIYVAQDFPFSIPTIVVPHHRWAGTPHVQWRCQLCLYAAPSIEWDPADGMFGLMQRLTEWLRQAAVGELDPDDQPLHPPVAYISAGHGVIVIRADLGDRAPSTSTAHRGRSSNRSQTQEADHGTRLVVGLTVDHSEGRRDLIEWMDRPEWLRHFTAGQLPAVREGRPVAGVLAVLCDGEMSFEYPKQAAALIEALETLGLPRNELFDAVGEVAAVNYELARQRAGGGPINPPPVDLLVGTPSRRMQEAALRQHLVCWRFNDMGRLITENVIFVNSEQPALAHLGELAQDLLPDWIANTETSWVRVLEDRGEVTIRRDTNSSASWIQGRRILVIGCGALGGPIAEFCVRGGAADVGVIDEDIVTPGILVRQPYTDDDIGVNKAVALSARLNRIRSDQPVRPVTGSAEAVLLADGVGAPDVDLVIDATANNTVAALIEVRRSEQSGTWPPIMSVAIGHGARRGVVLVSKRDATGGPRDVMRRLALAGRTHHSGRLADIAADLFPMEPRSATFQPEPGCSSPTFTGSAADLSALAGHLLDAGLRALTGDGSGPTAEPMVAGVVRLAAAENSSRPGTDWFGWPNDTVSPDTSSDYEIRISHPALSRMRAEVRRGARLRGPNIETGGLVLGQIDDACRCIWIDDVSGPPPDSLLSTVHFDHGVEGVNEVVAYHRSRSGRLTTFVGMWHSHPYGEAKPSETDEYGMRSLVTPLANSPSRALILIIGGDDATWIRWVTAGQPPDIFGQLVTRADRKGLREAPPVPQSHRTSAWPGGWTSRPRSVTKRRRIRVWPWRRRQLTRTR